MYAVHPKLCSMRRLTVNNWCIAYMTVPAFCPDGWRVWFGTAIFWCGDAGDPSVSSLKEAMHSTDTLLTDTCCDAKK